MNESKTDNLGFIIPDEIEQKLNGTTVVDKNGSPLLLYHGSGEAFSTFKSKMAWGTTSAQLAFQYAQYRKEVDGKGAKIIRFYMNLKNAFDADALGGTVTVKTFFDEIIRQSGIDQSKVEDLKIRVMAGRIREESGPHYSPQDFWYDSASTFGVDGDKAIRDTFERAGFDGIRFTEDDYPTFGAFDKSKVFIL